MPLTNEPQIVSIRLQKFSQSRFFSTPSRFRLENGIYSTLSTFRSRRLLQISKFLFVPRMQFDANASISGERFFSESCWGVPSSWQGVHHKQRSWSRARLRAGSRCPQKSPAEQGWCGAWVTSNPSRVTSAALLPRCKQGH